MSCFFGGQGGGGEEGREEGEKIPLLSILPLPLPLPLGGPDTQAIVSPTIMRNVANGCRLPHRKGASRQNNSSEYLRVRLDDLHASKKI